MADDQGASTLNTDFIGNMSHDNGSTWKTVPFVDGGLAMGSGDYRWYTGSTNVSGSSTNIKYKLIVTNNASWKIKGVVKGWR
jgi:hypothetical protein